VDAKITHRASNKYSNDNFGLSLQRAMNFSGNAAGVQISDEDRTNCFYLMVGRNIVILRCLPPQLTFNAGDVDSHARNHARVMDRGELASQQRCATLRGNKARFSNKPHSTLLIVSRHVTTARLLSHFDLPLILES